MRLARRKAPPARACVVYLVDGALLIRTRDQSDGLGIERDETTVLSGSPIDREELARAIDLALSATREIRRPKSWTKLSEYAKPLLAAAPGNHRSYRSFQRAARMVEVHANVTAVTVERNEPELNTGAWNVAETRSLDPQASPAEITAAVIELLID